MNTVSLCYIVCNDLSMLRATLMHDAKWADQIVVLDMGSSDGTQEFCKRFLGSRDVYYRRVENTIPERGFAEARNFCMELATCDWVVHWSSNCLMASTLDWQRIQSVLERADSDVIDIETHHVPFRNRPAHEIELATTQLLPINSPDERHRCIVRRASNFKYVGYLHEDLADGSGSSMGREYHSPLHRVHFEGSGDNDLRAMRYSYMLRRAMRDPALQAGTNQFWYKEHYPRHKAYLEAQATLYEEWVAKTGLK